MSEKSVADELVPVRDTVDEATYKRIARMARFKMDLQVVPLCVLLYLLSFLDRTNISQATLEGDTLPDGTVKDPSILTSLNMTPHEYSIAITVLYPTYMVFEVPANLLIKRVGPRIWIPLLVVVWGVIEVLQGVVTSKEGLYINRVFLGLAEAGIMPGIAVYLTFFYKPSELQFRQAFFFTGASLSGAFSGLLAAAIRKMDGLAGQHGWQWIFYLEGIFTVVVGFLCFFLLPNGPESCFLLTPLERRLVVERLQEKSELYNTRPELETKLKQAEPEVSEEDAPAPYPSSWWRDMLRAFLDIRVILAAMIGFCVSLPVFSLAFFLPTIVQQINDYSSAEAMLMSCPPYAVSFVFSLMMAVVSDRLRYRYLTCVFCLLLVVIGTAVTLGCDDPMTRYGGIIMITCGGYAGPPGVFSWVQNNAAGHYKRATAIAMVIIVDNCSGIASSWLFNTRTEAPKFTRGLATILSVCGFGMLISTALELVTAYERRQRARGRRDDRAVDLYKKTRWSPEQVREYLGDDHPEYALEL